MVACTQFGEDLTEYALVALSTAVYCMRQNESTINVLCYGTLLIIVATVTSTHGVAAPLPFRHGMVGGRNKLFGQLEKHRRNTYDNLFPCPYKVL
jgi:hypothetical protein